MPRVQSKGDFLNGRFLLGRADGEIANPSPADLDDLVGTFPIINDHIDAAVHAARVAQPAWERLPIADRISLLMRLGEEIKQREPMLVDLLSREIGKPTWEAKTEIAALQSKIDITITEGVALVRGFQLDGGKLECRYRPHGVLGVIGPYNFPLHLAHGHIVPTLATGNTVVFKPSEVAPATAQVYAEAIEATGFPAGVINVVQGKGASGASLSNHSDIDGLLFTGSYATGTAILRANAVRPGRMLALELGGKNSAVVLADAPWEKTLYDVIYSAFVTSGQRCTAVSRVIVERSIADRFIADLAAHTSRLKAGHPIGDVFMGPLATKVGFDKFHQAQKDALSESETVLAAHDLNLRGYYVTPSIHRVAHASESSAYQSQEIFGPDIAVFVADDLEDACRIANATPYGLAAGVFTSDAAKFDACTSRLSVGCIAWNAPTVGSSSRLPFGGMKNSGNHRPAALFSTLYCTYPVAITRGSADFAADKSAPGMAWHG